MSEWITDYQWSKHGPYSSKHVHGHKIFQNGKMAKRKIITIDNSVNQYKNVL